MNDSTLIEALARDVDAAFEALVRGHQDRLYTIALRLLADPADAEEVTQDAFARAHRALCAWDADRIRALALRPWLAAIVVNAGRNRRRRPVERRPAVSLGPLLARGFDPADDQPTPESVADRRMEAAAWTRRLAGLPPGMRAVVILRHVDGLSYAEVAAALGRPEGTVKAQVHRGLRRLRAMIEDERAEERREMMA